MSSGDSGELPPMWEVPVDPEPAPRPAPPAETPPAEPPPRSGPLPTYEPAGGSAPEAPHRSGPLPTYEPASGYAPSSPGQVRITPPAPTPPTPITPPAPTPPMPITPPAPTPPMPITPAAATPPAPVVEPMPPPIAPPAVPTTEPARERAPEPAGPAPVRAEPPAVAPPAPAPVATRAPAYVAPAAPAAPVPTAPAAAAPVPAAPAPAARGLAIDVRDLRVTYTPHRKPPVQAVRGISFSVREGEVLALLGPNGAGKTSTVEVLEGYREPSGGTVRVLGYDPVSRGDARALREQIGIVLQQSESELYLTVAESVDRNAGYYPWPYDPDEVLELVGLTEKANAQVRTLSGGQKRRLDLALGIIGGPKLLFLDEPTTGFDPSARRSSWDLIRSLRELGTTIVLTTHYMDEAQALADRIIVVAQGQIVAEGTPESLGGRATADARIRFVIPPALDGTKVPVSPGDHAELDGFVLTVTTSDPTRALHNLTGWALQRGARLESLSVERPTLEDIYLQLVGKEAGDK